MIWIDEAFQKAAKASLWPDVRGGAAEILQPGSPRYL